MVKKLPANAGDIRVVDLIPGLEGYPGGGHGLLLGSRISLGGGHGNPFQYSCLQIPNGQRSPADCGP